MSTCDGTNGDPRRTVAAECDWCEFAYDYDIFEEMQNEADRGPDGPNALRGLLVSVALSLPLWALIAWAVWRLVGR